MAGNRKAHVYRSNRPDEMSIAQHASPVRNLAINIRPDASWQHVPSNHRSKTSVSPAAPETVHVSGRMQMFDHTWQLSLFPLVHGASLLSEHMQLYPAPLQLVRDMGNPGDWDELCVSPRSLLSLEEPSYLPIFSQSLPLLSTWECAGNRQGKRFPYDRYNNSGKPLLFLFIIHLLLPGTKDGAANQMHKKTNQSCFCWAWFIARTLLHVERDEIWRDAPDYRCAFRC